MKPLPLPLRVAAGLAVTAVDRARHLPEKLAELPVTVVSQALQLSMRVQQQVTELAIKGDDALSALRPVEETPEWATFDEDKTDDYDATPVWGGSRNGDTHANGAQSKFDSAELSDVELSDVELEADDDADADDAVVDVVEAIETLDTEEADEADQADAPESLPLYAQLTLAQVRARLRRLDEAQLAELIDFEERHDNRQDFVGMLTRRLTTLRDQQ